MGAGNMNGQTCAVRPENLLLDTEDNLEGFSWDVKYMCSYGETSGSLLLSSDFDLSCNTDGEPRVIVLSMWEGNRDTLSHKKAKRRASLATDVCTSEKFSE